MRILGLGNYNELSYSSTHWLGQIQAFSELGHDFSYLQFDKNNIDDILADIASKNLDIIVLGVSDVFSGDFLERLRRVTNVQIVWWYCDFADYENLGNKDVIRRPVGGLIDHIFITNREQIDFYKNKLRVASVHYLPQACLKRTRLEDPNIKYSNKLVFVGETGSHGIRKERAELLDHIKARFQELTIYPNDSLTKKASYGVHHLFYPSAEITLGHSWHNEADLYTSNRIFIVLGNGGFYLCNRFKNMEEVWRIGEHLAVFEDKNDAVDKINYYLTHPAGRELIRQQGFEYAQKYHNYTVRMQNMLDIINGKVKEFYGYLRNTT